MNTEWMKLDNAAKIYPLVESDYITAVYRFSVTLDTKVDKNLLLKALNDIISRFPYFKVTLKKGFFWYYLEENKKDLIIHEDIDTPCRRIIRDQNNDYLFRVLYKDYTISVEFNHILADGTAGLTFLNTLVYQYLKINGYEVSLNEWIKDPLSEINEKEFEDSHSVIGKKHLKTHGKKVIGVKNVFHMKDRLLRRNQYIVTYSIIDSDLLYTTAKKYNSSITVFLTAIYLESMLKIQKDEVSKKKKYKPVSIQVPINMRKRLNSESMRNFSLFIIPYLMPHTDYTFEMIIEHVNQFFKEKTDVDHLLSLMVQNLKTEKSLFVRLLPLWLKNVVTPFIYKSVGVDTYSGTISNIGRIILPESIEAHVNRIDFVLGPCPMTKCSCSVSGYKNKIYITFGRNIKDARVEKYFFRKLVQLGVEVQIENHGGENL